MDLCSDGTVVNWDGMHIGQVEAAEGGTATINWSGGPFLGTEIVVAKSLACRGDGALADCPAG